MGAVLAATEQLGGRVEISSEVGQGTELRLVFPRSAMAPQLESVLGRAA
jgi:chemotaxis protein histidine kinase CheA